MKNDLEYALDLLEKVLKDGSINERKMLPHEIASFVSFHRPETEFQVYTPEHLKAINHDTQNP